MVENCVPLFDIDNCYKIEDCSVKIVYVFILGPPRSESAFNAGNCSGIRAGLLCYIYGFDIDIVYCISSNPVPKLVFKLIRSIVAIPGKVGTAARVTITIDTCVY